MKKIIAILSALCVLTTGYGEEETTTSSYLYNTIPLVAHDEIEEFFDATQEELVAEPQLDNTSTSYAEEHGGPLTQLFLTKLQTILSDEEYQSLRITIKSPRTPSGFRPESGNWHCDFHFEVNPENPSMMYRPNESFDAETRHFMLISSEPATEFYTKPVTLDFWSGQDWEEIQDDINSIIDPDSLVSVPVATIMEFRGNNIHRATTYHGDEPLVRYFIRASLFPKEHTHHGVGFREQIRDRFSYQGE